ncbi:GAP family protein [Patescibacteria group bacterium]|nr:GAP family protein [Patescibacteria group bacterium]
MGIESQLPTLGIVIGSAAIDSINPCAIGVLILMMSVVLSGKGSIRRMLFLGGIYVFAVFATYLIAGLGLIYILSSIPLFITEYLSIVVGVIIITAGIFEIKDFFWYGKGFSLQIPTIFIDKINKFAKNTTVPGIILLGAFVSAVELPCTGAPYLAIITILSLNFDFTAFLLLVLYNIIFVAPLIFMLILVATGVKLQNLKKWKQDTRGYMRLFIGLLLIALGWLLIIIANGTVNFG